MHSVFEMGFERVCEREMWCAFCPVKAACAFCAAAALLARSDTRVYLARRRLAANAKITYRFTGEEQNAHHGFTRPVGFQPNKARELRKIAVMCSWG